MLLHRGSAVSREYLAFLLYPDDEEASARAKLRATLADLPKILPKPADRYVTIDTDKVSWNGATEVWIDVEAFAAAANDRARLHEAVELYRGDLLPEVYDEWLDVIRERLRNDYLRCLSDLVSEARRNANVGLAIETARKILAVDPWREDVVRRLIAMRYEVGDRAGALSEYAAFAKRLVAELGTEPMPETAAVAERIARGEPSDGAGEDADRARVAGEPAVLPFVGRRDEMERLLQVWNRVASGRGQSAFVGGEPGIGKSRLVVEFARAVEERGGRVLAGATGSPEAVPYEGVVDALRHGLPLIASLKPSVALASVAALLPEVHARISLPALSRLDAQSERVRLFESIFRCIADLAAPRPLLLVVEDLHDAQPASIELVRFLLSRIAGAPVMILVTYRDEETPRLHALHRLRRDARTSPGVLNLWLSGLSTADVDELLATLPEMRERAAATLVAASQGNPLFLTQLVVDARDDEAAAAPASLQAAVRRRIERLSESARAVAEIAACIGDRFSREAVREVSAWENAPLTEALDELLDRRIVREAGGRGVLEYAFAHNLVHEAIAQSVPANDAAVRRRRVARVLEELYPERFSELSATLAAHYECAGDTVNAARCFVEAVRRSVSIGALEEARALCDRALSLDLRLTARVELLLERVTIESRRGRGNERNAALLALERADRELCDPLVHRETLRRRMEYAATIGDLAMQESAVSALSEYAGADDLEWRAIAQLARAKLLFTRGELAQAYSHAEAALSCSRNAGNESGVADALCFLAKVEGFRGNLTSAVALYEEAAQVAARAADPVLEMLATGSGWVVAYQHRDFQRCRELGERCAELAVELGDRPAEAQARSRIGISLLASEAHTAEARLNFAAAARTYEESGDRSGAGAQLMNRSVLEAKLGFFDRASDATEKAIALFERAGDERGRVGSLANLIYIKACLLDVTAAREAGGKALEDARLHGFGLIEASILENLAFAEAVAGDFHHAIELAEESFALRARSQSEVWSSKTLADVGTWYAIVGNLTAAVQTVRRLLSDEEAIARGSDWPSYCYWSAAQVLHAAGDDASATRALDCARRVMQISADALDPEDRASFLALPFHCDIARTTATGEWPNLLQRVGFRA